MILYDPTASEGPSVLPAVCSHLATARYHLVGIGMRSISGGCDRDGIVDAVATGRLGIDIGPGADFRTIAATPGGVGLQGTRRSGRWIDSGGSWPAGRWR